MRGVARLCVLLVAVLVVGCTQNWDLLEPEEDGAGGARTFTPIGEEGPGPLTGPVARQRLDEIQAASGEERLELIDGFLGAFQEARLIPQVHRAAGEAHLAAGRAAEAADSFERALMLTRTDLLGLPLEMELPLQLAMAALTAGDRERGLAWLARTTIAESGGGVQQAVAWAHAEVAPGVPVADWVAEIREGVLPRAPTFELPGFQSESVTVPDAESKATLINFWSPT